MKTHLFRYLESRGALCLLVALLSACSSSSDNASKGQASNVGDAGAAGQSSISICQMPAGPSECNPITGVPCKVDIGETCDNAAATDAFACIPGPNIGTLGGTCDNVNVFCGPTTVCSMVTLSCVHFCCDKSDCTSGECTPVYTVGSASVGACLGEIPTNDAAGAGGAGDGAAGNGGAAG
jgi:hypothetical protein